MPYIAVPSVLCTVGAIHCCAICTVHCCCHTLLCHLYCALLVPYIAVPSLQCFSDFLQTLLRGHRRTLPLPKMAFRETWTLELEVKERVGLDSTASLRLEISFQLSPPLPSSLDCRSICPYTTLLSTRDIIESILLVCSSVHLYLYSYPADPSTLTPLYLIPETLWN